MIGVVYLGKNPQTEERLKYLLGMQVKLTKNYKEAEAACESPSRREHFIVFYEKTDRAEDVTAITYLRKTCKNIYIILLTRALDNDERKIYQNCGINDTLDLDASVTDLNKKVQFIFDRESILFDNKVSKQKILRFQIPFWKEAKDMCLEAAGIIPEMRYVAWDVAITSDGPTFIEGNSFPSHAIPQFAAHYPDGIGILPEFEKFIDL
jgi:response regulator RpfG family c-di-GMP phosphodiesterase